MNYRLDFEQWFVSLADVRTHHSLDSNYSALLTASTLRNQLVNRFQLALFWSTKYSIHRKWLKVRGLGGSIARNVGFDNVLISNDIQLETRLKSNRTHQTESMS